MRAAQAIVEAQVRRRTFGTRSVQMARPQYLASLRVQRYGLAILTPFERLQGDPPAGTVRVENRISVGNQGTFWGSWLGEDGRIYEATRGRDGGAVAWLAFRAPELLDRTAQPPSQRLLETLHLDDFDDGFARELRNLQEDLAHSPLERRLHFGQLAGVVEGNRRARNLEQAARDAVR